MSRIYLAYRSKKQRFCAVQAFCAAKPWWRANSLRPSILISCRNPKNRRFCAVQAFCAAKPWRRANSLRPSILISCRNPKNRRFCAVQAFCAAKPWRRANSLRPSILISCRNPKKRSQHTLWPLFWSGRRGSLAVLSHRDTHSGRQTPHWGVFSLRSRPVRPSARWSQKIKA